MNDNVGVKDENDTNSTIAKKIPNTETIGNAIIEEDLVLIEKYRNMTNYMSKTQRSHSLYQKTKKDGNNIANTRRLLLITCLRRQHF